MALGMRLRWEAMIWVKQLGFSSKQKHPTVNDNPAASDIFQGIENRLSKYLIERFAGLVVEYKQNRGGVIEWSQLEERYRARLLRDYFWELAGNFP